jgi:predicted dehydrogenase
VAVTPDRCFAGFDAYRQVLAADVDVVLLATPPQFRPEHLKACVAADKHVFAEKPIAVDAPGVRSVLASCEEAKKKGLSIVSGLCYRFDPGIRETMKRVLDGAIGEILTVQETYNCGPPWFRNRDREAGWTEMEYQMRNWYPFTWLSGDHNVEQHVHSLDKGAWAIREEPPVQAWGSGGRQVHSENAIGQIYDHHCVVYEFASGVRMYSHCRRQAGVANEISDIFLGTKGTCDLMKRRIDGESPWRYRGPKGNMYVAEHEALFTSIRSGDPLNHGSYMAHSTMLAVLGRFVTYTGEKLTWDQALNSKEDLSPERYAWDAEPPVLPDEDGRYPIATPGITKFV